MTSYDYDLFVIGAGSGGVRAARIASGHGAKVAVAEDYRVGGTCVIRGCVPKKLFVYASRFRDAFEDSVGFGWTPGEAQFDWPTLLANKNREIERLSGIYVRNLEATGVEIIRTRAELADQHTVRLLSENRTVTAHRMLISTGAWPFVPEFPGSEHAITSNEAFELKTLPERMVIVGGGYISVEFAGIFQGLGVAVTQLYRGEQILRGFDDDLRHGLADEMRLRGVDLRTNTDIVEIAGNKGAYTVTLKDGSQLETELVMYATGRNPNTQGLGLENAGVELGDKGKIVVDDDQRTTCDTIYAVGDVTDRFALTPVAIKEGHAFADSAFGDKPWRVDHKLIPTAVFSQPELGTVGMTEAEARAASSNLVIYKARFRPMLHTLSGRNEHMLFKLLVDGNNDRVLGCHIIGPDAAEIVQIAAIALRLGATKADFDATMALHPSAAEELVTMRQKWLPPAEAAE